MYGNFDHILIPYLVRNKISVFWLHIEKRKGNLSEFIAHDGLPTHFSSSLSSVEGSERIHNGFSRDKFCSVSVQNLSEVLDLDLSLQFLQQCEVVLLQNYDVSEFVPV